MKEYHLKSSFPFIKYGNDLNQINILLLERSPFCYQIQNYKEYSSNSTMYFKFIIDTFIVFQMKTLMNNVFKSKVW